MCSLTLGSEQHTRNFISRAYYWLTALPCGEFVLLQFHNETDRTNILPGCTFHSFTYASMWIFSSCISSILHTKCKCINKQVYIRSYLFDWQYTYTATLNCTPPPLCSKSNLCFHLRCLYTTILPLLILNKQFFCCCLFCCLFFTWAWLRNRTIQCNFGLGQKVVNSQE